MPFGLMNAPSTFQRMMDAVPKGIDSARAYLDDVVIHLKTMDDHLQHLEEVLSVVSDHHSKLKISKCEFAKRNSNSSDTSSVPTG